MVLITIRDLSIGFRGPALFDSVSCQIGSGERIGLLGRNGAGKTTLMRLLCGELEPDSGTVELASDTRLSRLPQDVPQDVVGPTQEIVADGLVGPTDDPSLTWQVQQRVEQIISRMQLDAHARFETLSTGMKRRVLLARSLAAEPDILLLDEPTNHLDLDAIGWLEEFLLRWKKSILFVTHDRMFLRNLATRILEIDRGRLFDWSCDYETFLRRKEQALAAEEQHDALFDKKLAAEEAWIRQGIKARRTRNEGRVRALRKMRDLRRQRREDVGQVNLRIEPGQRSGNLVTNVERISFAYTEATREEKPIVRDFSTTIMRGDKVGIIGPNGAGKTTLLRLLLGTLKPQSGSVRTGTNLQVAYFDQLRQQLDEAKTVQDNVNEGSSNVAIGGGQHIIGYLQNFLFSPQRSRTELRFLSGGERNRVLLAKLFAKPANTIVLDEPTNDLDSETLELLEQRLVEFAGTVLLVSHDREFLNNVVTSTIVFENGNVKEYDGGYDDWLRQRPTVETTKTATSKLKLAEKQPAPPNASIDGQKRRLSFREKQELAGLPGQIESFESEISALHKKMAQPEFYQQPGDQIADQQSHLRSLEQQLADAYARWEQLE